MAEGNAAKKQKNDEVPEGAEAAPPKDRKSLILMILVAVNSLTFLGVGFGLYSYSKATRDAIKSETEISQEGGEAAAADAHGAPAADAHGGGHGGGHGEGDKHDAAATDEAKVVALESFYVNLSGSEGYKLLKVTMSLEVENTKTQDEITKRQAMIKDTVLVLLSSKTYSEVSGENAQQKLKDEIMDTVNSFLTKGKIKKILFTEFIFN